MEPKPRGRENNNAQRATLVPPALPWLSPARLCVPRPRAGVAQGLGLPDTQFSVFPTHVQITFSRLLSPGHGAKTLTVQTSPGLDMAALTSADALARRIASYATTTADPVPSMHLPLMRSGRAAGLAARGSGGGGGSGGALGALGGEGGGVATGQVEGRAGSFPRPSVASSSASSAGDIQMPTLPRAGHAGGEDGEAVVSAALGSVRARISAEGLRRSAAAAALRRAILERASHGPGFFIVDSDDSSDSEEEGGSESGGDEEAGSGSGSGSDGDADEEEMVGAGIGIGGSSRARGAGAESGRRSLLRSRRRAPTQPASLPRTPLRPCATDDHPASFPNYTNRGLPAGPGPRSEATTLTLQRRWPARG